MAHSPTALKAIVTTARQILLRVSPNDTSSRTQVSSEPLRCELPPPRPIVTSLVQHGFEHSIARQLSEIYIKNALVLKQDYENNMEVAIRRCIAATSPSKVNVRGIQSTYAARYQRALQEWLSTSFERRPVSSIPDYKGDSRREPERHTSFKSSYIVILEDAFQANAYPTRTDKAHLAARTGLELRQIQVWFQNRRSRSRKSGRVSQKMCFIGTDSDSESLSPELQATHLLGVRSPTLETVCAEDDKVTTAFERSPFHLISPPHAYPAPYPPVCNYDPFPMVGTTYETVWPRQTSLSPGPAFLAIKIDDLASRFQELRLGDDLGSTSATERSLPDGLTTCWIPCYPAAVYPPPAPLRALIRQAATFYSSQFAAHFVRSPTQQSTAGKLAYSSASHRRVARSAKTLPGFTRRALRSSPSLLREHSHPYASSAPLHHRRRLARLTSDSSLSSISSDGSSSSISSSPSSLDSPLNTPPSLYKDLPHLAQLPVYTYGSSPDLEQLFNSPPANPGPDKNSYPKLSHTDRQSLARLGSMQRYGPLLIS